MHKDTLFYKKRTIRCNNRIIETHTPLVMGILNVTPNSFFDGGKYSDSDKILNHVSKMLNEGADIIDIGAYSSQPGAAEISIAEELKRIKETLDTIRNNFPEAIISIDTFRSEVAVEAIEKYKVDIINDISAGHIDPEILDVVAEHNTAYIAMHMQGTPKEMQKNPTYKHVVNDILDYFAKHIELLRSKKINDIIIDPGFGFGKTLEQNYQLIEGLNCFSMLEYPLLVGLSRKSMIYNHLNTTAKDALIGTVALNLVALQKGANILRVHDVKEAKQTISIFKKLQEESEKSINLLNKI